MEIFRPLHQPMYHGQPRVGAPPSSCSQRSSGSQSSPSLPAAVDLGQALRALWELQAVEVRKPNESPAVVAPCLGSMQRGAVPSTAPPRMKSAGKSMEHLERRCDKVLGTLMGDSKSWGTVQEKQARLMDSNRDLLRKSQEFRNELADTRQTSRNFLKQSFSTSEVDWRSRTVPMAAYKGAKAAAPFQTATDRAYGVENAHHLASYRARAKTTHGFERVAKITKWGAEPSLERTVNIC